MHRGIAHINGRKDWVCVYFSIFVPALLAAAQTNTASSESFLPEFQLRPDVPPLIYKIPTNPASLVSADRWPNLSERSPELRPEALPKDVRYAFAPDAIVAQAAALLQTNLLNVSSAPSGLFGNGVILQPGAWKKLRQIDSLGEKRASPWNFLVWDGRTNEVFSGMVIRDENELSKVESVIRQNIREAGGGVIRALKTQEMRKWWIFIGFDIQEPVLVLETNDKKYRYIFAFLDGHPRILDELNGLPDMDSRLAATSLKN